MYLKNEMSNVILNQFKIFIVCPVNENNNWSNFQERKISKTGFCHSDSLRYKNMTPFYEFHAGELI